MVALFIDVEVLREERSNVPIMKNWNAWQGGQGVEDLLGGLKAVFWAKRDGPQADAVEPVADGGVRA